jgi:carboxyl-terminal processing protease
MSKRILNQAPGWMLGAGLVLAAAQMAALFNLFPSRDLTRASGYVKEVMQIVNEDYVDPKAADYDSLSKSAIHGMVESLDPHSEYLEASDNQEFEEELDGEFGGIGIQVEMRDRRVTVIAPMPGTPGERAGIERGDEIVSIDGKPVDANAPMDDVLRRLRGKPKTAVTLGLFRPAAQKRIDVRITREVIKVDSIASARVLPGNIGYIRITEFSEHTGDQFIDALNGLLKKNIDSLVLDLRDNPGGIIDSAVEVAEPFFRHGELIVYTQGRKPSEREDYKSENDQDPLDLPVAVLINEGTASAAEIVTGALKDTGRAVVVGERSFGKGSVQSLIKLRNGDALRLTVAHYFTPSGAIIHEKGIAPQVEVVMTADEDSKLRQQAERPDITDPKEFRDRFGFAPIADRQLQAACDVLTGVDMLDGQAEAAKGRK